LAEICNYGLRKDQIAEKLFQPLNFSKKKKRRFKAKV